MSRSFGPPTSRYRSPDFSAIRGARLTDSRIRHYMLQGYYGEERRVQAEAEKKKRARRKSSVSPEDLSAALELLSKL